MRRLPDPLTRLDSQSRRLRLPFFRESQNEAASGSRSENFGVLGMATGCASTCCRSVSHCRPIGVRASVPPPNPRTVQLLCRDRTSCPSCLGRATFRHTYERVDLLAATQCGVACLIIYTALSKNWLSPGVLGLVAAIFGYPLLLQSKLFTIRGQGPDADRSAGPQIVLELFDRFLSPGIDASIDDMRATTLAEWHKCDIEKLGATVRNYLASHDWPTGHARTKEETLRWLEKLLEDARANSGHRGENGEALFLEVILPPRPGEAQVSPAL